MANKKTKKSSPSQHAATPVRIVLDTNVFMRLAILEFVTAKGAKEGSAFDWAEACGAEIWLAPLQAAEIRRNARAVLEEHAGVLQGTQEALARSLQDALWRLGPLQPKFIPQAKALMAALEKRQRVEFDWTKLTGLIEQRLDGCKDVAVVDADLANAIKERVRARIERHDPPCSDDKKKVRPQVDCGIWELVITLLKTAGSVWFASTDPDFRYASDELHHVLKLEVEEMGRAEDFRFFAEDRDLSKPYEILKELEKQLPERSERTHAAVEASGSVKTQQISARAFIVPAEDAVSSYVKSLMPGLTAEAVRIVEHGTTFPSVSWMEQLPPVVGAEYLLRHGRRDSALPTKTPEIKFTPEATPKPSEPPPPSKS